MSLFPHFHFQKNNNEILRTQIIVIMMMGDFKGKQRDGN